MNYQLANFSTDLRRVSYWIYSGRESLAKVLLTTAKSTYTIKTSTGPYENIWAEIDKIKYLSGGRKMAADRASTMSSILLQESLKNG